MVLLIMKNNSKFAGCKNSKNLRNYAGWLPTWSIFNKSKRRMYIYRNGNLKIRAERLGMVALLLLVLCSFSMSAQNDRRSRRPKGRGASSEIVLPDKMELPDSLKAKRDSTFRADSISRADSLDLLNKSSL